MSSPATPPRLLPVLTFAVWTSCAVVGGLGLFLAYPRPVAPQQEAEPALAPLVAAELPKEPPPKDEVPAAVVPEPKDETPPPAPTPASADAAPPAAPPPLVPPDAPAFTPVAAPEAPVAFAVPVEGPVRVVPRDLAAPTRVTGSQKGVAGGAGPADGVPGGAEKISGSRGGTGAAAAQAQNLVLGQGEGAQAKPDYPREAQRRRQEGTVRVILKVDETGKVTDAEIDAEKSCAFPLLRQAALTTVRRDWHFPAGPKRLYTVAIKFVLQ